ncbi:hypothetical protein Mycsm_01834 [Mycobacterium sp. JS623]|uniref:hypothetical protein n=1 Tax=Mycobacterium sp. JS623 TaxID=212767 RepID=UPI0002A556DC|nr:hypothetical protein [Mycobacterium sp. JS623]AGB22219.1 hypothetical protein Mycsm_01834 [Mycobacterium sp. JS623]
MGSPAPNAAGGIRGQTTVAPQRRRITDAELAWALVETAKSNLDSVSRTAAFVEIGCGDDISAISRILTAAVQGYVGLPGSLLRMTDEWLDRYRGVAFEPALRDLLSKAHRFATPELVDGQVARPVTTRPLRVRREYRTPRRSPARPR